MKFKDWIKDKGYTIEYISKKIGIKKPSLYNICNGHYLPSLEIAVMIEDFTRGKVRPRDFLVIKEDKEQDNENQDN